LPNAELPYAEKYPVHSVISAFQLSVSYVVEIWIDSDCKLDSQAFWVKKKKLLRCIGRNRGSSKDWTGSSSAERLQSQLTENMRTQPRDHYLK
jgi:hypothetical protein